MVATIITLQANGYIIDFNNLTLEKSSLVALQFSDRPDEVKIDSKIVDYQRSQLIKQINPGRHELVLSRSGYHNWYNSFRVEPGQAQHYENIKFFLTEPLLLGSQVTSSLPTVNSDPRLLILGSELWLRLPDQLKLITRYSEPILAAKVLADDQVVFLAEGFVRVINVDGSNDIPLLQKPDALDIAIDSDSQISLYYSNKVETYKIR